MSFVTILSGIVYEAVKGIAETAMTDAQMIAELVETLRKALGIAERAQLLLAAARINDVIEEIEAMDSFKRPSAQ